MGGSKNMEYSKVPEMRNPGDVIISKASDISAPITTVFEVIEDIQLFVELEEGIRDVKIISDVKQGKGMKSRWVMEDMGTHEVFEVEEEIIHYDKPYQYVYVGSSEGREYSGVHTLTENSDGTTNHLFNEAFYFDIDIDVYNQVVGGMVENVKREAERRHNGSG
jgi:uncharacterized membrane protein